MSVVVSLAIIAFAALIHSSFQLSVSVLTLLSAHALGTKKSHVRIFGMTTSFVIGVAVMTALILSTVGLIFINTLGDNPPQLVWAIACGLMFGVAISVWLFYYRRQSGTVLWIPRSFAKYLTERAEATKLTTEAFGLGVSSVVGELLFIFAPILISALTLTQLPALWVLAGILTYTVISTLPLVIVWSAIGSGHSLSKIQHWREMNKRFLQFAAGAGLIVLATYVYVTQIIATIVGRI